MAFAVYNKNFIMKNSFKILFIAALFLSFQATAQLQKSEDGLYYDANQMLYTGDYVEFYDEGQMKIEMSIKDGEADGGSTFYYPNGQIQEVRSYEQGRMHGEFFGLSNFRNQS